MDDFLDGVLGLVKAFCGAMLAIVIVATPIAIIVWACWLIS